MHKRGRGSIMGLILSCHTGTFDSPGKSVIPPKRQTHLYMCIMLAAPFPDRYTSGAAVSALLCQEQIPFAHDFRYIGDLPKQKKHS